MIRVFRTLKATCWFCAALAMLGSCSKENPATEMPGTAEGNVVLTFRGSSATDTRSSLNGAAVDYRNVREVFLLIFSGTGGDAALLRTEEVAWQGAPAQEYRLRTRLEPGGYTIVAVGTDDMSPATYGLTAARFTTGTKLSEARAALQSSGNAETDKRNIAQSDFYAGKAEITVAADALTRADITMTRREAGIMVYLKNIPCEIRDESNTAYTVDEVRVDLHTNQHTALPLLPPQDAGYFGSGELENSSRLCTFPVGDYPKSADGSHYLIPAREEETLKTLPNTLYAGQFILPIAGTGDEQVPTLTVTLWHKAADAGTDKEYGKVYPVKLVSDEQTRTTDYDIRSNHLYCIGRKEAGANTDSDRPLDMLGNLIEIVADEYEFDTTVEVVFPPLVIPGYIAPEFGEEYIFDCMNTFEEITVEPSYPNKGWTLTVPEGCDWIELGYFEDAERTKFVLLNTDGKMVTDQQAKSANLLDDGGKAHVTLLIRDYVKWPKSTDAEWAGKWPAGATATEFPGLTTAQKAEFLKKDFRTANLQLTIQGIAPAELPVRQYNAVPIQDANNKNFGISRLDFNHWFSRDKAAAAGTQVSPADGSDVMNWGFSSTNCLHLFGSGVRSQFDDDGLANLHHAYTKRRDGNDYFQDKIWIGSLIQITCGDNTTYYTPPAGSPANYNNPPYNSPATNGGTDRLYRQGASYTEIAAYHAWFVPAEKQLDAIAAAIGRDNGLRESINLSAGKYWSITTDIAGDGDSVGADAYAYDFGAWKGGDENRGGSLGHPEKLRVRLARYYDE